MKTISDQDAKVLLSFYDAFMGYGNASWVTISHTMQHKYNISDPETALEDACAALRKS
jgi:hypothetical protein